MLPSSIAINSKLPWVGTTIFTVMSKLAAEYGAINLSQGFPDFQADPSLFEATLRAMRDGRPAILFVKKALAARPAMSRLPWMNETTAGCAAPAGRKSPSMPNVAAATCVQR